MNIKKIFISSIIYSLSMYILFANKVDIYGLTSDYDKENISEKTLSTANIEDKPIMTATIKSKSVVIKTNPLEEPSFNVKLSYYSEKEATDVKGNENKTALGKPLFDGVIAVPREIPLYSLFLIEDELGKEKVYIALDRGNPKYVKMLSEGDSKMKLDVYIPNASEEELYDKGLDIAKSKILRLGPGEMDSFEENKTFVEMLNKKLKNSEPIDSYFIKTEIIPIQEDNCSLSD